MKNLFLIIIILITFGCKKDIPNLYTSVEGNVTDYYSKQPISCHPILIIESTDFCFFECEDIILDTAFSDTDGYYFYDFYNDSSRTYTVFASKTENYFYDYGTIVEGKKNRIDLSLKPFKKLYLKCINQSNKFNRIHIVNLENTYQTENFYDNNFKNCEAVFHIIPEKNVNIVIKLQHINELNEICNNHTAKLDFFAGKNDTTITCYY